jgi:hypothetical protein
MTMKAKKTVWMATALNQLPLALDRVRQEASLSSEDIKKIREVEGIVNRLRGNYLATDFPGMKRNSFGFPIP